MTVRLMVMYPLNVPEHVLDDVEQLLYNSTMGRESGEVNIGMFIDHNNYPSLKKHLESFGVQEKLKIYVEAKLDG
jgi:hypothetical protein